jgi:hypothetical protein
MRFAVAVRMLPAIVLIASGVAARALAAPAAGSPVRIAVFDFELEDATPAGTYLPGSGSDSASLEKVSSAARQELAQSGRYDIVDVSKSEAQPVKARSLRNCDGCEAPIALQLGAEQALIGVVKKVTATDYYMFVQIRDARTGKILDQQGANFAGSEEGWPSGVRMLIKHQVLATPPD